MKRTSILAGFVFPMLVPCLLSAQDPAIPVCTDPDHQVELDMWGTKIVWSGYRSSTSWDIFLYDINTGVQTPICTVASSQSEPAIWGNRIVWKDFRDGDWDIYMYDLVTRTETPICTADGFQSAPKIWENIVVWEDFRNGKDYDLYMYDINTQTETPVCARTGGPPGDDEQRNPDVWGYHIVWEDTRNGNSDIYMYNWNTQEEHPVCIERHKQQNPAISGLQIVWQDDRNGDWDIYLYALNFFTGSPPHVEWPLTYYNVDREQLVHSNQTRPDIQGNSVVYQDDRAGNENVTLLRLYNRIWGSESIIAPIGNDQRGPVVWDSHVVWEDYRHGIGNSDVYRWEPPPGADLAVTVRDEPDPVKTGGYVSYTIRVMNNGPAAATNVVLADTIGWTVKVFSAATTKGTLSTTTEAVQCLVDHLEEDSSFVVTILGRTNAVGMVGCSSSVSCDESDPYPENNVDAASTTVTEHDVDNIGKAWDPTIVVDSLGYAHMASIRGGVGGMVPIGDDPAFGRLIMWHPDVIYATNSSGEWRTEIVYDGYGRLDDWMTINPTHHAHEPHTAAIAIDSSGTIHLVYVVRSTWDDIQDLTIESDFKIYYTYRTGESWTTPELVDSIAEVIDYVWQSDGGVRSLKLAVDPLGGKHISYVRSPWGGTADAIYWRKTGASWEHQVIEEIYWCLAMTADQNGYAHMSYYYGAGPEPGLFYLTNAPSGIWQAPVWVDSIAGQLEGLDIDIAVDGMNRPHISYLGTLIAEEDNKYAWRDGGVWHTMLVDTGTWSGSFNRIALESDTVAHMLYVHQPTFELRHARVLRTQAIVSKQIVQESFWGLGDVSVDHLKRTHLCYEENQRVTYLRKSGLMDDDADGIADELERGPAGTDPFYDGNGDGLADCTQPGVASFPGVNSGQYVTVALGDPDFVLTNVQAITNPDPDAPGSPREFDAPYGFFKFTILGLEAGGGTTVRFYLTGGPEIETYYKFGRTLNEDRHWYEFNYDGETGCEVHGDSVTMHLVDGKRGDDDVTENGIVVEPGTPAFRIASGLEEPLERPLQFGLGQNYPNPFNPTTVIPFSLPSKVHVRLRVYDLLGREVKTLLDDVRDAGTHAVVFDGSGLSSSVYFYRIEAGKFVTTRKCVLVR